MHRKQQLVIIGLGNAADVMYYFFHQHSDYDVVAFAVHQAYRDKTHFHQLPVVAIETLTTHYPPDDYAAFVATGYANLNRDRARLFAEISALGYQMASYIHPSAGVPTDLHYGNNVFIMNDVHIHPRVVLGDNLFIWSGVIIGHHSQIASHCWLTSGVNIAGCVSIGSYCFLGINATVTNHIIVGQRCFIGASSLVSKHLSDEQVVITAATQIYPLSSPEFLALQQASHCYDE